MKMKILLVDDQESLREVIKQLLQMFGHEVAGQACSGNQAFEMFRQGDFDMIFTDCEMPNGTGIDLIKKVKALYPGTPIIMASGKADESDSYGYVRDGLQAGAMAVLEKPFDMPKLRSLVKEVAASLELEVSPL